MFSIVYNKVAGILFQVNDFLSLSGDGRLGIIVVDLLIKSSF